MATETPCQTPGARYHTSVSTRGVTVNVEFGTWFYIDEARAKLLEDTLHNAVELALAPLYVKMLETED